tara:strand:- start:164 stop:412 length:249 start_codon:yes stop_codon:yes gene_type:complete
MAKHTSYTSKGERPNVSKKIRNAMRNDYVGSIEQMQNKVDAWLKDKHVTLTIPNPSPHETRERFIKVPAKQVWGTPQRLKIF